MEPKIQQVFRKKTDSRGVWLLCLSFVLLTPALWSLSENSDTSA